MGQLPEQSPKNEIPSTETIPPDKHAPPLSAASLSEAVAPPGAMLLPGGEYHCVKLLGKGGMGKVYLAKSLKYEHTKSGVVAIKLLASEETDSALFELFRHEAFFREDLQHDNLAVAYRFIDFKGEHCGASAAIVQKRYHGSLDDTIERLRSSPIASERALDLLKQVAAGVAYLHKKGFVHRDLKTPNVLVDYGQEYFDVAKLDRFHFVVADFGVIWRSGVEQTFAMSQEGYGTGKLANWKAPETVDSNGRGIPLRPADPKQDIWSFGEIIRKVVEVTDGKPDFLLRLADECQQLDPQLRPSATELERRLSVHWAVQQDLIDGGMRLLNHPHYIPRQHVAGAISRYKERCRAENRGGVVILETPPGWGKTAFLTHEANQPGAKVAFYFVRGQRDDPQQMTRHLVQSLSHLAKNASPTTDSPADQIENLLATAVELHRLTDDQWLIAYVDGIDESRSPRDVLSRLPQRPPPHTLLVLGTRPLPDEGTLLSAFDQHGALRLTQNPASIENRENVASYFRGRLDHKGLTSDQADSLASNVGGSFQLARPLVDDVLAGTLSLDDLMKNAKRLSGLGVIERYYAYYQQSWDRSILPLASEDEVLLEQVLDLLRLVCVAQTALSKDQAKRLLGWTAISNLKFDRIIRQVAWFVRSTWESREGFQSLYLDRPHETVLAFLTQSRDRHSAPLEGELPQMHRRIGAYFAEQTARQGWTKVEPYGRAFGVRHMIRSGEPELLAEAERCLTDVKYLAATLGDTA